MNFACPQISPLSGHNGIGFSFYVFHVGTLLTTQDGFTVGHLHLSSQNILLTPSDSGLLEASLMPHFRSSVKWVGFGSARFPASHFQIGSPQVLPLFVSDLLRHIPSSGETKHSIDSLLCHPCSTCQKPMCSSPVIALTMGILTRFVCSWVRSFSKTKNPTLHRFTTKLNSNSFS